jgi:ABC-type uncharacterized transport system ATPase subunit
VAINVDPDILIVDEALSVGDMYFQEKSFTRMKQFRTRGKTVFFVSHSLSSVRNFCDRAIWIDEGEVRMIGYSDAVCTEYQEYINKKMDLDNDPKAVSSNEVFKGNKIFIEKVSLNKQSYLIDDDIELEIELRFEEEIKNFGVGVIIYDGEGNIVTLYNTVRDDIDFNAPQKRVRLIIPQNDFVKGKYYVTVVISDELCMFPYDRKDYIEKFYVETKKNYHGIPIAEGMFRSKHLWEF